MAAPCRMRSSATTATPTGSKRQCATARRAPPWCSARVSRARTFFWWVPCAFRAGVTIVVDPQVAVWGSRDPRNYDVAPGSCGIVADARGPGCKPLFVAQDAAPRGALWVTALSTRGAARSCCWPKAREGETWWELAPSRQGGGPPAGRAAAARRAALGRLYALPHHAAQLPQRPRGH